MRTQRKIFIAILGVALLVGCNWMTPSNPQIPPTPTETSPPTVSPFQPATSTATIAVTLTFTPTATATETPAPSPLPIRVPFTAEDGRELIGYYYPSWKANAPVVVMMHQFEGDQAMWRQSPLITWMQNWWPSTLLATPTPSADGLLPLMPADLSFAVFTFDFRGHGESLPADIIQDGVSTHALEFLMDAHAAYQTARQMPGVDPNRMIGLGASIGGDAVVDACTDGCVGAFSISPGSWLGVDYGVATQRVISQGKPVRCMYAVNDYPSPAACLSTMPNEYYRIFSYPGKKHGMTFVILPRKMEADFGEHLFEFLKAAIQ